MKLVYYILLKPLSYLPDHVLHWISDFCSFVLFYLIPYRKGLVLDNLKRSFPEKSTAERKLITRKFYRQFCDTMIEMVKGFSITEKESAKRIRVVNPEVLLPFYDQGRSIIISGAHYANWEAATLTAQHTKHELYGLYTPISNKFLERKVTESRSRFGFKMISTKDYKSALQEDHPIPRAFVFAADQSPKKGSGHWMTFLGQDTAVLFGTEKTAKEYDLPVVFGQIEPVNRGRYELTYKVLIEDPRSTKEGEIAEICMREVERQVRANPHNWLWTHRRWKHNRTPVAE